MPAPVGPIAQQVTADAHRVAVEIDISEIAGRLEREAMRLINDLSQQGLTGDDLADAVSDGLAGLSDAPLERAGRGAASEGFNLGRNLEAQAQLTTVGEVVRSEILDQNTCDPCRELDGKVMEINSPDYFEFMPPNQCNGRELCRGMLIYRRAA